MRESVLYIAMSLDGYIADKEYGVAWLGGDGSDTENAGSYPEFYESVDTIILGYRTYHQIITELFPDGWIYSGKTSYVLTHKDLESTDEIIFTGEEAARLVSRLKKNCGKDIWICGGAEIVNQLLKTGCIDRYHISVIPVILGDGVRLFEKMDESIELVFAGTQNYDGIVDLIYRNRTERGSDE